MSSELEFNKLKKTSILMNQKCLKQNFACKKKFRIKKQQIKENKFLIRETVAIENIIET